MVTRITEDDNSKVSKGISKVIGLVLLIAIAVAIAGVLGFFVVNLNDTENEAQAGTQVEQTQEGVQVRVIDIGNAEEIQVKANGSIATTLDGSGQSTVIGTPSGASITLVGVTPNGNTTVLDTFEAEEDTTTIENSNSNSSGDNVEVVSGEGSGLQNPTGVVSINPKIKGATVKALDSSGTVIETTTTNENGKYKIDKLDQTDSIVAVVNNFTDSELSAPLYASAEQSYSGNGEVSFTFKNPDNGDSGSVKTQVDGRDVLLSYQTTEQSSSKYYVGTAEQLQGITDPSMVDKSFELASDIDASETGSWNDGKGFKPVGKNSFNDFTGVIDGEGHTISGLTINRSSENDVGLLGDEDSSTIKDIRLDNASITGDRRVGGIVGKSGSGDLAISRVAVTDSSITGDKRVGGIVGDAENYNLMTIEKSYSTGSVNGGSTVGGLVGEVDGDIIRESYSHASVSGDNSVGGLVGKVNDFNDATSMSNSYAAGPLSADNGEGGLVGSGSGSVSNSYWSPKQTGTLDSTEGKYLDHSEMVGSGAVSNFGFDSSVWEDTSDSYPILSVVDGDPQPKSSPSDNLNEYGEALYTAPGIGTKSNPHKIDSIKELQGIREYHKDGHIELVSDIDASVTSSWNSGKGFKPVGYDEYRKESSFSGSIDGNGYTISDLTIDRGSTDKVGLVGEYKGGTIKDIRLENASITGNRMVGGLVGQQGSSAVLSNIAVTNANISGSEGVGGIVGSSINVGTLTINESYSTGSVSGSSQDVGGLVGGMDGGTVRNSYSHASVSGDSSVGGLIGHLGTSFEGTIENSYAIGETSDAVYKGGLIGEGGSATVSNSYWDPKQQAILESDGGIYIDQSQMTGSGAVSNMNLDSSVWQNTSSSYPILSTMDASQQPKPTPSDNLDEYGEALYNTLGLGTSSNPHKIDSIKELQGVREYDHDANIKLVSDIDASGTSTWDTDGDGTAEGFNPIGYYNRDKDSEFRGSIDGNGYTISNLTIDRPSKSDVGLVGMHVSGEITDITLDSPSVSGRNDTGALVGDSSTNISTVAVVNATVSGRNDTGGIVGRDTGVTLKQSYITGSVTGSNYVGGLIGQSSGEAIINSYSHTSVDGNERVGGLVGSDYELTIKNSYATGSVSGTDSGGIIASSFDTTVTDSYWDTSSTGQSSSASSGTGLTTSEMQGSSASSNMNFDFNTVWTTVSGDYPELRNNRE